MSLIKKGYNDKPTIIHVRKREAREAEFWIEQHGIPDENNPKRPQETLAYVSLDELLELRDEINAVIQELVA